MNNIKTKAAKIKESRQLDYGDKLKMHVKIGRIWGAILDMPDIPASKVAKMMAGFKILRSMQRYKPDNYIDAYNYLEFSEEFHKLETKNGRKNNSK